MKKFLFTLICFFTMFTSALALDLSSTHVVLYNLNEDKIIFEEKMEEETSIASLTKIMTTIVAIENINDYSKKVTMTSEMFKGLKEANAAVIGLYVGETVTYNDLLYGMFVASGADATRAIAITLAGSEENFVKMMNKKAKDLNLKHTNFVNTTGLDEENHYSTVEDVATILKYALKNDKFKEIFKSKKYTLSNGRITIESTVRKSASYYGYNIDYVEGAKTGYTYDAGRCLASIAYDKENDIEYLLVTTNAEISYGGSHVKDAVTVYNYYFKNFKYHNIVDEGDTLVSLDTKYAKEPTVDIKAEGSISHYLNNTFKKDDIELKYTGIDLVTTGMSVGDKLGELEVIYKGEVLEKLDILLDKEVEFSLMVFLKENKAIVIVVGAFLLGIILVSTRKKKNRKK